MIELASEETISLLSQTIGVSLSAGVGTCWALSDADGPVAIWGCQELWPGCAQMWAIIDHDRVRGQGVWLTRQAREIVRVAASENNYRQIRTMAMSPRDADWLKLLGFEMEGVWLAAGPQEQNVYILVYHRRH